MDLQVSLDPLVPLAQQVLMGPLAQWVAQDLQVPLDPWDPLDALDLQGLQVPLVALALLGARGLLGPRELLVLQGHPLQY